jgi:hypothetical protein
MLAEPGQGGRLLRGGSKALVTVQQTLGRAHVESVGAADEKVLGDEIVEDARAGAVVETEQALRLPAREPQAGHLEVLSPHAAGHLIMAHARSPFQHGSWPQAGTAPPL